METQPLLSSPSELQSDPAPLATKETRTSARIASEVKRSLTNDESRPSTSDTSSSNFSLRFFKANRSPTLPTIWKSDPTGSRNFQEVPIQQRSAHGLDNISPLQFFMQIIRASVGTGVLALPSAVANAGLVFGIVGIIVTSLIIIHSVNLLVQCAHFLRSRFGLDDAHLDYGSTVDYSFMFGTESVRRFRWASKILNLSLGMTQLGFCIVYILFVSESIRYLVDYFQPSFGQPLYFYILICAAVIFPLIFVRSIRKLSYISGLGNVFMFVCMVLIFIYCFQDIPPIEKYPLITNFERIPLFFGVAVFAFESINVVLPTEMALSDKRHLMGWTGLLNMSLGIVLILYIAVAFFGYVKFGETVKGSITYSLLSTPWYTKIVMPIYALLIAMSFGLQYYILSEIVWQAVTAATPSRFHNLWIDNMIRIVVYFIIVGIAAGVPLIEHVISLTGALGGSSICLIFPPLIHTVLFWDHSYKFRFFKLVIAKNIFVMAFGIFGAIIGSYTSVLAIYKAIHEPTQPGV